MKKMISLFLSVWLIISLPVFVFAEQKEIWRSAEKNDLCKNSTIEIKNEQVLITKIEREKADRFVVNEITVVPSLDSSTSEIVEKIKSGELSIRLQSNNPSSSPGGIVENSEHDSAISMLGWVRSTYSQKTYNAKSALKLIKCSGGATVSDPSVQLVSQNVIYACNGRSVSNNQLVTQRKERNPSMTSWSYNAPSTWVYVFDDAAALIGCSCTFTMKRVGSSTHTWSLIINANVRVTDFTI